jgi:hypothetical protein
VFRVDPRTVTWHDRTLTNGSSSTIRTQKYNWKEFHHQKRKINNEKHDDNITGKKNFTSKTRNSAAKNRTTNRTTGR